MRAEPSDLTAGEVAHAVEEAWGFRAASCDYAAVGGGSHHWRLAGLQGEPHWITVDGLDGKPFLGDRRETVLAGLKNALEAAAELHELGCEFVVAPRRTPDGEVLTSLGPRYALTAYAYLEGDKFDFGDGIHDATALELAGLLARLHAAEVQAPLRRSRATVPYRSDLELALKQVYEPWSGGPYSEQARVAVARQREAIAALLREFDRLAAMPEPAGVITHGEPHPGNLVRLPEGLRLVDWDTVALDAPERDVWWLADHPAALARYEERSGRRADPDRLRLYALRWQLDDVSSFVQMFRSPHVQDADTERWASFGDGLTEP